MFAIIEIQFIFRIFFFDFPPDLSDRADVRIDLSREFFIGFRHDGLTLRIVLFAPGHIQKDLGILRYDLFHPETGIDQRLLAGKWMGVVLQDDRIIVSIDQIKIGRRLVQMPIQAHARVRQHRDIGFFIAHFKIGFDS